MFRLLFISGIVDRITVGQLHVGTVLIFYGGIVIGLFLKVITNSFGGESEASVRDFRSGLSGLRPIVHCPAHDRIDNDVFLRRPGTEETFTEPGPVSRFGILFVEFERIPGTVQVFAAGVSLVRFFVFVDPGIEVFVFYKVQNDCKGTVE